MPLVIKEKKAHSMNKVSNHYNILQPALNTPYESRPNLPKQTPCPECKDDALLYCLRDYYNVLRLRSRICATIYLLQLVYGLRFIDVKSIKNSDITSFGIINIIGSKKSSQRLIYFPDLLQYVSTAKADELKPIIRMSYRQYYSTLRRAGIIRKLGKDRKNYTVTHLMRKYTFEQIRQAFDMPDIVLRNFSGHKSQAGLNYYIGAKSLQSVTQDTITTQQPKEV